MVLCSQGSTLLYGVVKYLVVRSGTWARSKSDRLRLSNSDRFSLLPVYFQRTFPSCGDFTMQSREESRVEKSTVHHSGVA